METFQTGKEERHEVLQFLQRVQLLHDITSTLLRRIHGEKYGGKDER